MKVQVHNIVATCPGCGAEEFVPAGTKDRHVLVSQTPMVCAACSRETAYIDLQMQIADKAITRSVDTLQKIRDERAAIAAAKPKTRAE